MEKKSKTIDWSDNCWKEMLVYQRKMMRLDDNVDKLASWLGLRQGMTAVDIGCGLGGYLGYTYWPCSGEGGHYIGIDNNLDNIKQADRASSEGPAAAGLTLSMATPIRLPSLMIMPTWSCAR